MPSGKASRPAFDKYGGHYHLRISTVEDLEHILSLEDGRWMATSCPLFGINVDAAFLRFLDADGNGRIVSDDVRAAVRWLRDRLRPSETWTARTPRVSLSLLNTDHPEGEALDRAARHLLDMIGQAEAEEISLEQVRNRQRTLAQADFNGDGVMPPEVLKDPDTVAFARDLVATLGGIPDASGRNGVNEALLDRFRKEAGAYLDWHARGTIPEGETETDIMAFGTAAPAMTQTIAAVRDKVEQFFAQCALVRFDPRMAERMGPREEELTRLDYRDREAIFEHLRVAALARPNAEAVLPLGEGLNEFYRAPIDAFRTQVVAPMFGEEAETLTEHQWREILREFAPYEAWVQSRPATPVGALGLDKLRAYLDAPYDANIRALVAEDKLVAAEVQQLQNLEKLLLYHQGLFEFLNNYVSLPHLFDPERRAIFEMGTLVLAGRAFAFSVRVENRAAHATLAKNSGLYLLYLQITGTRPEDAFEIAVPVTRGSSSLFYVGKRGVFFTSEGRELDAQIVQIVENSISLWEAVKAPFARVFSMIGARFSQIAGSIQKESETMITATTPAQQSIQTDLRQVQQASEQPATPAPAQPAAATSAPSVPPPQEAPRSSGNVRDAMIGIGFLVAGLGTALKFLVDAAGHLTQPRTLQVLVIMLGVFVMITVLIAATAAWFKMRGRDLGVLLQASGWAINGRMRLVRPMARFFTRKARLPRKAKRNRREQLIPLERLLRKKSRSEI